jgi:hypothetical protein
VIVCACVCLCVYYHSLDAHRPNHFPPHQEPTPGQNINGMRGGRMHDVRMHDVCVRLDSIVPLVTTFATQSKLQILMLC